MIERSASCLWSARIYSGSPGGPQGKVVYQDWSQLWWTCCLGSQRAWSVSPALQAIRLCPVWTVFTRVIQTELGQTGSIEGCSRYPVAFLLRPFLLWFTLWAGLLFKYTLGGTLRDSTDHLHTISFFCVGAGDHYSLFGLQNILSCFPLLYLLSSWGSSCTCKWEVLLSLLQKGPTPTGARWSRDSIKKEDMRCGEQLASTVVCLHHTVLCSLLLLHR